MSKNFNLVVSRTLLFRLSIVVLIAVTVPGCATTPAPAPTTSKTVETPAQPFTSPDGTVLYRWVQLVAASVEDPSAGADPQLLARALVANSGGTASCPDYTLDGGTATALNERQNNPDTTVFPVLVCEIVVPVTATSLSIGGDPFGFLPLQDPLGQRIYVIGDTGCRDNSDNPCTGGSETSMWGFPSVVGQMDSGDPTVIVHVGDYIYRQVLNAPGCQSSYDLCDSWANWEADFFAPANLILDQVPWVLSRGNHEECDASTPAGVGGNGWFFLLDPHTPCLSPGCTGSAAPTCTSETGHSEPYALDLGFEVAGSSYTLRLLMVDSSDADDSTPSSGFDGDFATLQTQAAGADTAWLVTHRPLFGIRDASDTSQIRTQDQELQQANEDEPLADNVGHVFSGHMHIFETTNLTPPATSPSIHLPSQVIVGDSGVNLVNAGISGLTFESYSGTAESGDVIAGAGLSGVLFSIHGFMSLEPSSVASGTYTWAGTLTDSQGDDKLTCTLTANDGGGTSGPSSNVDCQQE